MIAFLNKINSLSILIILIIALCPFLYISRELFLKDPLVWPDEALFTNISENIIKSGNLSSNLLGNAVPGYSEHAYWMPPGYFYLLAGWMSIFGTEIESVRALSLFLAITSLSITAIIIKKLFNNNLLVLIGIFFLSNDYWFSHSSRVGRMEMLSLMFLITSLAIMIGFEKLRPFLKFALTGLISGLSIITHPLSIITPSLILVYLISSQTFSYLKKNIFNIIIFAFLTIIIPILWLFSMKDAFYIFIEQYSLQLSRKTLQGSYLFNLVGTEKVWIYVAVIYFLITIILFFQYLFIKKRVDLFILLSTILSISTLLYGKEAWYLIYFQPFITFAFLSILKSSFYYSKFIFSITLLLLSIVLIANFYILSPFFNKDSTKMNYHNFTEAISKQIPDKSAVFLYSIPDPYFGLKSRKLTLYEFSPVPVPDKSYKSLLNNTDYMVITPNNVGNRVVLDYIKNNMQSYQQIDQGYSALLIKLTDKNNRR